MFLLTVQIVQHVLEQLSRPVHLGEEGQDFRTQGVALQTQDLKEENEEEEL